MKHQIFITTPEISKRMSKIKAKKNKVEVALAKKLWHSGFRYRLNYRKLPGSPDIALTRYKIAVFVDGSFWHGKDWELRKNKIKSNRDYWIPKIEENQLRDEKVDSALKALGWRVIRLWDCDINKNMQGSLDAIFKTIKETGGNDD